MKNKHAVALGRQKEMKSAKQRWLQDRALIHKRAGYDDLQALILALADWKDQEAMAKAARHKTKSISVSEAGKLGGKATAAAMTKEERSARASAAISAFWAGKTPEERTAIMKARAAKRKKNENNR